HHGKRRWAHLATLEPAAHFTPHIGAETFQTVGVILARDLVAELTGGGERRGEAHTQARPVMQYRATLVFTRLVDAVRRGAQKEKSVGVVPVRRPRRNDPMSDRAQKASIGGRIHRDVCPCCRQAASASASALCSMSRRITMLRPTSQNRMTSCHRSANSEKNTKTMKLALALLKIHDNRASSYPEYGAWRSA